MPGNRHHRPPALHPAPSRGMGSGMKWRIVTLLASFLGTTGLRADLSPAAWHSEQLPTAGNGSNTWYFLPDLVGAPRIFAKTNSNTAGNTKEVLITGGPLEWISDAPQNIGGVSKQGVFIPKGIGEGFLVAANGNSRLNLAVIASNGSSSVEPIDTVAGTFSGISAELDKTGKLHVGYIWNGNTICYARRNGPGDWDLATETIPGSVLHDTAVVPVSFNEVALYYCATATGVRTLWRSTPKVHPRSGGLFISFPALPPAGQFPAVPENKRELMENFVGLTLKGARSGDVGWVYYFGSNNTAFWKFRRTANNRDGNDPDTMESPAEVVSPASIHVATRPDGSQRVVWYDELGKEIHYLKPSTPVTPPALAGTPVQLTGNIPDADVLGLHFDATGMPYILYNTTTSKGFIAYPNDNFDFNGNGRAEIIDLAFESTTDGLETLPVKPFAPNTPDSDNRFKFTFPVVDTASGNGINTVTSPAANLRYSFELSTNNVTWAPPASNGDISFVRVPETNRMLAIVDEIVTSATPRRFARVVVSRLDYPY